MPRLHVLGCPVDPLDSEEVLARARAAIRERRPSHHLSVNASKLVRMRHDRTLAEAARGATTVAADGAGVLLAARLQRRPLPERVTGCDLATRLLDEAASAGWTVWLLGARPEVVAELAAQLTERGVRVLGFRDGYLPTDREREVAEEIARATPDLLLVAMGTPRSEHFLHRWGPVLRVPWAMGVGGTFDVLTGRARRAPRVLGEHGLEWAWRLAHEPRARFRRAVLDAATFLALLARDRAREALRAR